MHAPHPFVLAVFALGVAGGCTPPQPPAPPGLARSTCTSSNNCGPDRTCDAGACRPCEHGECSGPGTAPAAVPTQCGACSQSEPLTLLADPGATTDAPPATDPSPPKADPKSDPRALLLAMEDAYAKVRDYTVTLVRRERVKGKLLPQETMQVKFRKPYSTYIRWTGSVYNGREALYIRGKNGNKLRAHQGSFPDVTVDLDPRGGLAMKGNRHPITEGSLGDLIGLLVRDLKRAESRPQDGAIIQDLGESDRLGRRVHCFDAVFTVADGYYAPHVQVCMFTATNLPSRVQVWDAREQLLEDYEYRDLKTNVGLRDLDFDSTNPKYNF